MPFLTNPGLQFCRPYGSHKIILDNYISLLVRIKIKLSLYSNVFQVIGWFQFVINKKCTKLIQFEISSFNSSFSSS